MRIKAFEWILDMLFPIRCPVCDKIVVPKGRRICKDCEDKLVKVTEPYCLKCGKPLRDFGRELCKDCNEKSHTFDRAFAAFVYDDTMRRVIYRFKYHGRAEYAGYLGNAMSDILRDRILSLNTDAFIPVPMYKKKEKKRGFNQAELLSREMSRHFNVPTRTDIVLRNKSTKIMRSLGADEREKNLKKAFKLKEDSVKLKNVVIIDDIYTTGSTADAVAKCLKAGGVERVYVVALSIGKGN